MRLDPITLTVSRLVQGCYAKLTHSKVAALSKLRSCVKSKLSWFNLYKFDGLFSWAVCQQVMPDDHSKLVPLLPIPNRTVKRLSADDSADSRVKVGHRQALTARNAQLIWWLTGLFLSFVKRAIFSAGFWSSASEACVDVFTLCSWKRVHKLKTSKLFDTALKTGI